MSKSVHFLLTIYNKYSFTNDLKLIKIGDDKNNGKSALLDMCIFNKLEEKSNYRRVLNIEFKHKNATKVNISKDILKLIHEDENGAFILLLKNTDAGTLISVFKKFSNSFINHKKQWKGVIGKFIEIIIISLEEKKNENGTPFLIHQQITEISNIKDIFTFEKCITDLNDVKKSGWKIELKSDVLG